MYSPVQLRKYLPDGSLKFVASCYRLADSSGFVRLFLPDKTPRVLRDTQWTPEGTTIAALDPARPYVVHCWRKADDRGFYVDMARSIELNPTSVTFVDLLLDVAYWRGTWRKLDEEEVRLLSESDAAIANRAAADVLSLGSSQQFPFDPDHELWKIPDDAVALPALPAPAWAGVASSLARPMQREGMCSGSSLGCSSSSSPRSSP